MPDEVTADQDIETALVILADRYNRYLYRTDTGWVVNSKYFADQEVRGGSPSSRGVPTIREAIAQAVSELQGQADMKAEQATRAQRESDRIREGLAGIPVAAGT